MNEGWWYARGEDRQGPLTTVQMRELAAAGVIDARTLVWRPGRLAWKPLHEVEELSGRRMEPVLLPDAGPSEHAAPPSHAMPPVPLDPTFQEAPGPALPPSGEVAAARPPAPRHGMRPAGPWRRFFARIFDTWTLCVPAGILLGAVGARLWPAFGLWLESPASTKLLGLILVPLAMVLEAIVFGLFGSTPGKLLWGIRITLPDGSRPNFLQYLGRTARLYGSGLGLCIPFVTLATMGVQFSRLKKGRPASYDEGRFLVRACELGALRAGVAATALACLVAGVFVLQRKETAENLRYYAGFEWTNPATKLRADIPRGWQHREQATADGDVVHTFISDSVVAVFAAEGGMERVSLEDYQRLWVAAVRPSMTLDVRARPVNVKGRFGLQVKGAMTVDASRHIDATLLKSGGQVWRMVLVGTSDRDPDTAATAALRDVLFQTVPSDARDAAPKGETI